MKQTITLTDALADMVLAEDVKGKEGGVLLPKGMSLSEKHIEVLKMKSVETITIQVSSTASSEKHLERLEQQFSLYATEPVMQQLKQILVKYYSGGENGSN